MAHRFATRNRIPKTRSPRKRQASRRLFFESLESRRVLAVFTVTSTADVIDDDKVDLTLREAILLANEDDVHDEIKFNIDGGGSAQTITLGTYSLPYITNPVTIDGSTQGGLITIDADAVTDEQVMTINIGGDGTTLRGFNISNAASTAIYLSGDSNAHLLNNTIEDIDVSWEGTDPTGIGIVVTYSDDNTIQNVTATNRGHGVSMYASASNAIVGCQMTGASSESIRLVSASNNLIYDNTLVGSATGVGLWVGSDDNTIQNNHAWETVFGIRVGGSDGNTVAINDVRGATYHGIGLVGTSAGNVIWDNDASGSFIGIEGASTGLGNKYLDNNVSSATYFGIMIWNDTDFLLSGNNFSDSGKGLSLGNMDGLLLDLARIPDDLTTAGSVSGGALELYNVTNSTIDGLNLSAPADADSRGVGLSVVGGSGNTIQYVTATNRGTGIYVVGSDGNKIVGCEMTDASGVGIYLYDSSHNVIEGNILVGSFRGVMLWEGSDDNWVERNNASETGIGIYLASADGNTILDNDVLAAGNGVQLGWTSAGNVIQGNNASGSGWGIYADSTGLGNQYLGNNVSSTASFGISISNDTDFVLSGNDFSNSGSGLYLGDMDDMLLDRARIPDDLTTSGLVSGEALVLVNVTNSTIHGLNLSAPADAEATGVGLTVFGGSGNTIQKVTAANRGKGIHMYDAPGTQIHCVRVVQNDVGIYVGGEADGVTVSASQIEGNTFCGLQNGSDDWINAEKNYWGAPDGPSNLGGSGDSYCGNVGADRWRENLPPCLMQVVDVDVKPGNAQNKVNAKSQGVIPVAILTTLDFDAATVDASTIRLSGVEADHFALEDVDNDGDLDLILHFRTQDVLAALGLDLESGESETVNVELTGETVDEVMIQGFDTIEFFMPGKQSWQEKVT